MLGVIERIKNNVLQKCSNLNEKIVSEALVEIIDTSVYRFSEDIISLISDTNVNITEEKLRYDIGKILKGLISKKVKRKLFIDSLALQITNDSYIEDYINNVITMEKLQKSYIKELNKNKNSNQLNMTEDLDLTLIFKEVFEYIKENINKYIKENNYLVNTVDSNTESFKLELEDKLKTLIKETDQKYLNILIDEINNEMPKEESPSMDSDINEEYEREINTMDVINEVNVDTLTKSNKFDKYDDMTLFNKTILSLNTKEEKLTRNENKLKERKQEIEQKLADTNRNIEANIERENKLAQRKLELNNRELELNAKLSEAEVIFLNMKPLINGLNKIKASDVKDGE